MTVRRAALLLVLLGAAATAFAAGLWVLGDRDDLLALALAALGVALLVLVHRLVGFADGEAK